MMIPEPDRAKLIAEELKVTPPVESRSDGKATRAYDLRLFEALNLAGHAVLELSMRVEMNFEPLGGWSGAEIGTYLHLAKPALENAWGGKHTIIAQGTHLTPPVPSVVFVRYSVELGRTVADKHWTAVINRAPTPGKTERPQHLVHLDMLCLTDKPRQDGSVVSMQRTFVHEFGHMQGLLDEYDQADRDAIPGNPHLADRPSMMNHGEEIRPRHYAPLAHWLTRVMLARTAARRLFGTGDKITFAVLDSAGQLFHMNNSNLQ